MRRNISINCPQCYSRSFRTIATRRGFSFDKAATGAMLGGLIGGHALGLAAIMGIDGKVKRRYLQCDICGHVWSTK